MVGLDLKLGFATNAQATEFLRFIQYLEWCGSVGHSANITVNADGDGAFKFSAFMRDPKSDKLKKVSEILKKSFLLKMVDIGIGRLRNITTGRKSNEQMAFRKRTSTVTKFHSIWSRLPCF